MKRHLQFVALVALSLGFLQALWLPAQANTSVKKAPKAANKTSNTAQITSPCPGAQELISAGRAAGVEVHQEEVFSLSRGAERLVTAPIVGWENIPATQLRFGVNFAFAYFDTRQIPRGYYTLRAQADVTDVGTLPARVQLINRFGGVVFELEAEAEIHSLTVPPQTTPLRPFVTTADIDASGLNRPRTWYRCPNGQCIRLGVPFEPRVLHA